MQEAGASLVAISPEKPDHGIIATEENKLTFPVLSDLGEQGCASIWYRVPDRRGDQGFFDQRFQE